MRTEKCVDGLECDLEAAEAERSVGARIQPDVHQLIVIERNIRVLADSACNLRIAWRRGIAVPIGAHADGGTIDRPQIHRTLRIAGELNLHCSESTDNNVLQHLFAERTKAVIVIGIVEIVSQYLHSRFATGKLTEFAGILRLDAPLHSGNTVLDAVDGLARDGRLCKFA